MATGRTEAKPGGRKGTMSLSSDRSLRGPTQSCTFRDRTHTPQSRGAGGGQEHGQSRTQQPTVQAEGAAAIAEAVRLTSLPGRRPSSPSNLRLLSKRGSSLAVRGPPRPSDLHQHASKGSHSPLTGSGGSGWRPCPTGPSQSHRGRCSAARLHTPTPAIQIRNQDTACAQALGSGPLSPAYPPAPSAVEKGEKSAPLKRPFSASSKLIQHTSAGHPSGPEHTPRNDETAPVLALDRCHPGTPRGRQAPSSLPPSCPLNWPSPVSPAPGGNPSHQGRAPTTAPGSGGEGQLGEGSLYPPQAEAPAAQSSPHPPKAPCPWPNRRARVSISAQVTVSVFSVSCHQKVQTNLCLPTTAKAFKTSSHFSCPTTPKPQGGACTRDAWAQPWPSRPGVLVLGCPMWGTWAGDRGLPMKPPSRKTPPVLVMHQHSGPPGPEPTLSTEIRSLVYICVFQQTCRKGKKKRKESQCILTLCTQNMIISTHLQQETLSALLRKHAAGCRRRGHRGREERAGIGKAERSAESGLRKETAQSGLRGARLAEAHTVSQRVQASETCCLRRQGLPGSHLDRVS